MFTLQNVFTYMAFDLSVSRALQKHFKMNLLCLLYVIYHMIWWSIVLLIFSLICFFVVLAHMDGNIGLWN